MSIKSDEQKRELAELKDHIQEVQHTTHHAIQEVEDVQCVRSSHLATQQEEK